MVDASVFVEYLAPGAAQGDVAFLFEPESRIELWTPDLCLLEVANALRKRYLTDKRFTRQHLADAVADLIALGPLVVSGRVLVERALQFADNLSVYDAVYLTLAASRTIPICTLDIALASQARAVGVTALVPRTDLQ